MDKKVVVLTPNGRRQNVRVTPNTTLLQILEEACQKHGFDSDDYCLKHHNKEIGLTQMFRFSGLPNNCLLEMWQTERKRVPTNVDICVQLEDGSRTQGTFSPSDTLWLVLTQLCAEASTSYENPVVIYTRQEIIGEEKLTETTLRSLGIIEGRAMLRFLNKKLEDLKTQANVYIAPTAKDLPKSDTTARSASSGQTPKEKGGGGGFAITKDLVQSLKKQGSDTNAELSATSEDADPTDAATAPAKPKYDWGTGTGRSIRGSNVDVAKDNDAGQADEQMEIEPEITIIGERNALIYSLDSTQKQMDELPDSFFDLTVQDLKLVLRDLRKISAGNEDAPLLTEKLRELEENKLMLNKIAQYKNCVIRVKFPDSHVLQGMFKPIDRISNVVEFVRKFLHNPDTPFHLFTIPPKNILPLDKTLLELDFVPTAVLHFTYAEDANSSNVAKFVKGEFLGKLTSVEGAVHAANKFRISNRKTSTDDTNNNEGSVSDNPKQYVSKPPGPSTGAIPKRPRSDDDGMAHSN